MAFLPIGFHTNLILNRLRNERRIDEDRRADEERRRKQDEEEQAVRAAPQRESLADLTGRVSGRLTE